MPKGSSYLTIGWKQVSCPIWMISTALVQTPPPPDLDGPKAIQTTSAHLHLSFCLLSPRGCKPYKLGSSAVALILSPVSRVLIRRQRLYSSARTINSNSHSSRTPISASRRQSRPPPGKLFPATTPNAGLTGPNSTLGFWYIQRYWKIPTKKMVGNICGHTNPPFTRVILVYGHERRSHVGPPLGNGWYLDS